MGMFIIGLAVIAIFLYDDYLDKRGRYHYSVLIGIKGDDDSIKDYRMYANCPSDARQMAISRYCIENEVEQWNLYVYAVEQI